MAVPAVAGCLACLCQAYRQVIGLAPSGAMLKALLIHGTKDLQANFFQNATSNGSKSMCMTRAPNTFQGYGLVSQQNSMTPMHPALHWCGVPDGTAPEGVHILSHVDQYKSETKFVVTLAWTDGPGEALTDKLNIRVVASDGRIFQPLEPNDILRRQAGIILRPDCRQDCH